MAIEGILPELSWLLSCLCLAGVIILIAMCVCSKHSEKVQEYGTAGRLSITRDSPIFHHPTSNGNIFTVKSPDLESDLDEVALKRNSWTVKDRALPDIPHASLIPPPSTLPSSVVVENHITVDETNQKRKSYNKPIAPKPPASETVLKEPPLENAATKDAPHVMKITVNDKIIPLDVKNISSSVSEFGARPRTQIIESIPGTSSSSVVLTKVEKAVSTSSPLRRASDSDARSYEETNHYAEPQVEAISVSSSPVCIRIGAPINPGEGTSAATPAGLAVAGAVPSSDIPYMTPPLLHNNTLHNDESRLQENVNSPARRSEVPYTVISVREPLAKVREMTFRKQRMVQQKSDEGENQYAMVPEEEQMYAEIGSGQDSGSSSITYAHIEPRELPPVPPTVESLKSVAHAHSRQASTVSTSSFGSCISGSIENASPPSLRNAAATMYSTVEKHAKQRKTIHVAEGASVVSSIEKHKNVEDLYAKVRKKRVDMTVGISGPEKYSPYQDIEGSGSECLTPPPSPWASTTPPAPPPITGRLQAASLGVLSSTNFQHVRRHSADPNLPERIKETGVPENKSHFSYTIASTNASEPGYEQIYNEDENSGDSCYEKIKDDDVTESKCQIGYASAGPSDSDQNDFGFTCYESLKDLDKDSSDPGYECVAQLRGEGSSSDPGYEPVRISSIIEDSDSNHGYTTVNLEDECEPNYETVKKVRRTGSDAVDPGYEKVKKVHRSDSDATDPGYEKVKNKNIEESGDPGYETVHRSDSDTEPGYETVRHQHEIDVKYLTVNNKSTTQKRQGSVSVKTTNSTVLYVSGNSTHKMKQLEPKSKDSSDDSSFEGEGNATFL